MARINGSVLGSLSGRLGNFTARTVEGKTILAARPSSFTPCMDQTVVDNRSRFGISANFAKFVLTIGVLYNIWKSVKKTGMSVFNTVLKYNYRFSSTEMPTAQNVITPDGFNPPISSLAVDAIGISASLFALNEAAVITPAEVNLSVAVLVCFHNPISPDSPAYQIIPAGKEIESFNVKAPYDLIIPFNDYQKNIQRQYGKNIIYLALVTKDVAGNVVRYSSTYTKQSE